MSRLRTIAVVLALLGFLGGCGGPWNNPYPARERGQNILYSAFVERPKHLDPAQSYAENEYVFISQIYVPPLQYHYLRRPYQLVPLSARRSSRAPYYLDAGGRRLPDSAPAERVAFSVYDIHIRQGVMYQPHPAFAVDTSGKPRYLNLTREELKNIFELRDFRDTGTRELVAEDYVFQIRRLAHPGLHSPIFGLMSEYIVGLKELGQQLQEAAKHLPAGAYLDLKQFSLEGARTLDRYTYRITLRGKYPQFVYWLAMPFFAPVPEEADRFYSQPGMREGKNLTLDWYPVGTGPYMLTVNDPNRMMVLERNPNFTGEPYPADGEAGDAEAGLLDDAGKPLPFIDKVIFSLEKESIPYWNKFLQGYYDISGISRTASTRLCSSPAPAISRSPRPCAEARASHLQTAVATSIFTPAFNMLDPVVGGYTRSARANCAMPFPSRSMSRNSSRSSCNGRGVAAQRTDSAGHFRLSRGSRRYRTRTSMTGSDGRPQRKPIAVRTAAARRGRVSRTGSRPQTGKPLVLYFDATRSAPTTSRALDWLLKQFAKLNIQLVVRDTDYNRFQDKMLKGTAQMFYWGWNADYPDPENFLFLLYGPTEPGAQKRRERRQLRERGVRPPVRAHEGHGQRPRAPGASSTTWSRSLRRDAPWAVGLPSQGLQPGTRLGARTASPT